MASQAQNGYRLELVIEWTRCGRDGILFRVGREALSPEDNEARFRAVLEDLEAIPPEGLRDYTPAFNKVLLEFEPSEDAVSRAGAIAARWSGLAPIKANDSPILDVPVIYDGEDLCDVAEIKGLTTDEVVELHAAPIYTVAMLGFAPGFPYLSGLDPRLHAGRRPSPRPLVPAGSVAIGGPHTGIYSIDSPAGWHLIGRTDLRIFDPERGAVDEERMFLLGPGDRVRFVPFDEFDE